MPIIEHEMISMANEITDVKMKFFSQRLLSRLFRGKSFLSKGLPSIENRQLLLLSLTLLFCSTLYAQDGTVHNKSITIDSVVRDYILYVPAVYDGQEEWPLVINYHDTVITHRIK